MTWTCSVHCGKSPLSMALEQIAAAWLSRSLPTTCLAFALVLVLDALLGLEMELHPEALVLRVDEAE